MIVPLECKTIWWAMLALVALWQGCGTAEAILVAPAQRAVMLAINDDWPHLGWNSTNLDAMECLDLAGVESCDANGWVTIVSFNGPATTVPAAFGNMTALTSFSGYQFGGDFPAFFATMPSLQTLTLDFGFMTGFLPSDWSAAASLSIFSVRGQAISGPLPTILPPSLYRFTMRDNRGILSGSIPPAFLEHPTLYSLTLPQSGLSGAIPFPANLSNSVLNTYSIDKRRNDAPADFLYGELPRNLFQWSSLATLSLMDVAINGSFPSDEIPVECTLQRFIVLDWATSSDADVQMTGSIPPEIGRCTSLVEFNVWNARMSGVIPIELVNISSLRTLHLATNEFEGTLPTNWPHASGLVYLNLARNNFHGPVPAAISVLVRDGALSTLYLDYNDLQLCGDPEFNLPTNKLDNCNARFNDDSQFSCECRSRWSRCVDAACPPEAVPIYSNIPTESGAGPIYSNIPTEADIPISSNVPAAVPISDDIPPEADIPIYSDIPAVAEPTSSPIEQETPISNEEPPASPHYSTTTPETGPFSTPPSSSIPTGQSPVSSSSITQGSLSLLFVLLICYFSF